MRLDFVCVLFTVATTAIAFAQKGHVNTSLLILSIQSITDVIGFFSISIRMYADFDNFMTSSQRLYQYTSIKQEDALDKEIDKELQKLHWPSSGDIKFDNVTMRYRDGLEPSIKNLHVDIKDGMKVGIVGRTGSGKSSILQALFRLVELCEGSI